MATPTATYLGLKIYEWLTLFGVIIGPLTAVVVTLWFERRAQVSDRQAAIARTLMGTRHLPADPQYNGAINLIPIEFNTSPAIMKAWREYIDAARYEPTEGNRERHQELLTAKQSTLIFKVLKHLKYDISESDIRSNAYASNGFVWRDNLLLTALASWPRIAAALEHSAYGPNQPVSSEIAPPVPTSIPGPSPDAHDSPSP